MNTSSHLEDYIYRMYCGIHVTQPNQLDLETIAIRLGLSFEFAPLDSMHINGVIFIDSRKSPIEQWQDFCHELCHALMHFGNQSMMPIQYKDYLEWRAINFAQHACIPSFMLDRMDLPYHEKKAIWVLQKTFHVDYEFAKKRLYQYNMNRSKLKVRK